MAIADGDILACTFPDSRDSGFPTGVIKVDHITGVQTSFYTGALFSGTVKLPAYIAQGSTNFIYVTNFYNVPGPVGGQIIRMDIRDGSAVVVSDGGYLDGAGAMVWIDGFLYVCCVGQLSDGSVRRIVKIDPNTGAQTLINGSFGGSDSVPAGIARAPNNAVYVCDEPGNYQGTNHGQIWKVSLADGSQVLMSSHGLFNHPLDVTVDSTGTILILNTGGIDVAPNFQCSIFKIDPNTGQQSPFTILGNALGVNSISIADSGTIYVGSIRTSSLYGGVYSVDPVTGNPTILSGVSSSGGLLSSVEGIFAYSANKFSTPPPTGNMPVTVKLAVAGRVPPSNDPPEVMMRCPICKLSLASHTLSGASPNQMVSWKCVSGHKGVMREDSGLGGFATPSHQA